MQTAGSRHCCRVLAFRTGCLSDCARKPGSFLGDVCSSHMVLRGKKKVPAPIATLRNLNIVQNGKSSKPAFRSMFMWKSRFQGFKFVGIFRKASLFSFWASGIAAFRTLLFLKPRTQVYHKISQENSNLKGS